MLAAWALAAASVQLVQRRPGVLDATHATQDARARATARAALGKKAAERRRESGVVARTLSKENIWKCQHGATFRGGMWCC